MTTEHQTATADPVAPAGTPPTLDGIRIEPPAQNSFIEPAAYFSDAVFELEQRVVFPSSWIFVGDLGLLSQPGDYVTEIIGTEPVIVVRDRNGDLRAFLNVCPHRASTLAEGSGNCGRRLVCPYHGWTFELDGRLVAVPYQQGFDGALNREALGLQEVRVDTWEQFVFVNVSGDAPPLSEWLHPMPEQLAGHQLAEAARVHEIDDQVAANWKVMMDNAFCDYHLPFVHAESIGPYADPDSIREDNWDYTGRIVTRWTPQQLADAEVLPSLQGDAALGAFAFSVFPNWFIAAFPNGGAMVLWWNPLTIDRSRARLWSYSPDAGDDQRADFSMLEALQQEDYAICEKVQQGLRSRFYRPGPQHYLELKIGGYQRRLMTMLAHELSEGRSESHA